MFLTVSDIAMLNCIMYRIDRVGKGGGASIYVKSCFSILKAVNALH